MSGININVENLDDFKTPFQFLESYGWFVVNNRQAGTGVGEWVRRQAIQFNSIETIHPETGMNPKAAMLFERYMEKVVEDFIESDNFKAVPGLKPSDYKLSGNGTLANAFKNVRAALAYGADLVNDGKENSCPTVSKCKKFASDRKKLDDAAKSAAHLRETFSLELEMEGNLVKGTAEFEAELDKRMRKFTEKVADKAGKKSDDADEDNLPSDIRELVNGIESLIGQYHTLKGDQATYDILKGFEGRLRDAVAKTVHNNEATASGFVSQQANVA